MKTNLLFLAMCAAVSWSAAQVLPQTDYFYSPIRLTNPKNWTGDNGKITETSITVTPKGLFSQIDLELSFAAYNPSYFGSDTVELSFGFSLPTSSSMIDSWLWIENEPVRALLIDAGSASATYESIVKRRKDPSILTTYGYGYYNLQIYPFMPKETRKVKLSYLVLNKWTEKNIKVPLPINILGGGYGMEKVVSHNISLAVNENGTFNNPMIGQNSEHQEFEDSSSYKMNLLPSDEFHLIFDSPLKDGKYVRSFETNGVGYFEMAYLPKKILDINSNGVFTHFDLHTSLTNGITFDKTYLESEVENPTANVPILEIGSYKGDGNFQLTTAGELGSNIYSNTISFVRNVLADTIVKRAWAATKISKLQDKINGYYYYEDSAKRRATQNAIIDLSLENRILTRFTSFLALEKGMSVIDCPECDDYYYYPMYNKANMTSDAVSTNFAATGNSMPTSYYGGNQANGNGFDLLINGKLTKNGNKLNSNQLLLYPNPIAKSFKIDFASVNTSLEGTMVVEIYNNQGAKVFSREISLDKFSTTYTIDLSKENIHTGVYNLKITSFTNNIVMTKTLVVE